MGNIVRFVTEAAAARQAVEHLEAGRSEEALEVLRWAIDRRRPRKPGKADERPAPIVSLRLALEKAALELEQRRAVMHALATLRTGLIKSAARMGDSHARR